MKRIGVVVGVIAVTAWCGGGLPSLVVPPTDAAAEAEAAVDAPTIEAGACDLTKPFAAPVLVPMTDPGYDFAPFLTSDELAMLFSSVRADGSTTISIYAVARTSTSSSFGAASFSSINGSMNDSDPALTADALTLYFRSDRAGSGTGDIYVATRPSTVADFSAPSPVSNVNDPSAEDEQPAIDADGSLWLASERTGSLGGADIFHAPVMGSTFGTPVDEAELNSTATDWSPTLSADGLTMYFATDRDVVQGNHHSEIYVAHRPSLAAPFEAPQAVAELTAPVESLPHWLSRDGCRLYLSRSSQASYAIYVASR